MATKFSTMRCFLFLISMCALYIQDRRKLMYCSSIAIDLLNRMVLFLLLDCLGSSKANKSWKEKFEAKRDSNRSGWFGNTRPCSWWCTGNTEYWIHCRQWCQISQFVLRTFNMVLNLYICFIMLHNLWNIYLWDTVLRREQPFSLDDLQRVSGLSLLQLQRCSRNYWPKLVR